MKSYQGYDFGLVQIQFFEYYVFFDRELIAILFMTFLVVLTRFFFSEVELSSSSVKSILNKLTIIFVSIYAFN